MTTQEIKQNVHLFIDEIENKQVLEDLYTVLKGFSGKKTNVDFWERFTADQKKELEIALEQSEQEDMLVSHDRVMEEAKSWIRK